MKKPHMKVKGKGKTPFKAGRFKGKSKGVRKKKQYPPQVLEIAKEHNLPAMTAYLVYKGKKSIDEALAEQAEKAARKEKAREIMKNYPEINLALACLLVKEGITPEEHFQRRARREEHQREIDQFKKQRMQADESQRPAFEYLSELQKEKIPVTLAKYGQEVQHGTLQEFTPYEFLFVDQEEVLSRIHRLRLKYMYKQKDSTAVTRMIMIDKSIQARKLRPSHGPQGRFVFPEGVLEEGNELLLALHEGEMIRGKIIWVTPYDILLKIGKGSALVFRHAVLDCKLMRRNSKK